MPRGIYKRKKRLGRPKGVKNKPDNIVMLRQAMDDVITGNNKWVRVGDSPLEPSEPSSHISRLEAATLKYEQVIEDIIAMLKGQ